MKVVSAGSIGPGTVNDQETQKRNPMKFRSRGRPIQQLLFAAALLFLGLLLPFFYFRSVGGEAGNARVESVVKARAAPVATAKPAPIEPVKLVESRAAPKKPALSAMDLPKPRGKQATNFDFDKTVKEVMKTELLKEIKEKGDEGGAQNMLDKITNGQVTFYHGDLGENCFQVCSKYSESASN